MDGHFPLLPSYVSDTAMCHVSILQEVQSTGNAAPSGEPDEERGGAGGVAATGSRGGGAAGVGPSRTRSATVPSYAASVEMSTSSSKDVLPKEPAPGSIYGKGEFSKALGFNQGYWDWDCDDASSGRRSTSFTLY